MSYVWGMMMKIKSYGMLKPLLTAISTDIEAKFYDVNYGGCGAFANIVAKQLNKHYSGVFEIKVANQYMDIGAPINEVIDGLGLKSLKQWNDNDIVCRHIVLIFDNGDKQVLDLYDSDGIDTIKRTVMNNPFEWYAGSLTLKQLDDIVSRKSGWNNTFDRDQIPEMKNCVKKIVKEYLANMT